MPRHLIRIAYDSSFDVLGRLQEFIVLDWKLRCCWFFSCFSSVRFQLSGTFPISLIVHCNRSKIRKKGGNRNRKFMFYFSTFAHIHRRQCLPTLFRLHSKMFAKRCNDPKIWLPFEFHIEADRLDRYKSRPISIKKIPRWCGWMQMSYLRGGLMLNIWTSLLATANMWYKRPTFGAKATSCTGSVTALNVSVFVHLPLPPMLYSRMNTFPPADVLVSSLPAYNIVIEWLIFGQEIREKFLTAIIGACNRNSDWFQDKQLNGILHETS